MRRGKPTGILAAELLDLLTSFKHGPIEVSGARSLHAAEPFSSRAQIGAAACVVFDCRADSP